MDVIIDFIIAILLGLLAGTFTGLLPGIHINLIAAMLLSALAALSKYFSPIQLAIFIVSMSITHTFLDFIPSIFLGAPEEDTFLSLLPGHQLLKEGRGYEACVFTLVGAISALPAAILLSPVFIYFLPIFYSLIKSLIPFVLIFVSLYMIFREGEIIPALIIFILTGFLGFATFSLPIKEPLMPLLSGLFGISSLLLTIKSKSKIKKQKIVKLKSILHRKKEFFAPIISASIASPFCSFLPGIGSGHAAVIASEMIKTDNRKFLVLVGASSVIVMGLSFATLFAINKTRTGSAAAVQEVLKVLSLENFMILSLAIILSAILAFLIGIKASKIFSTELNKISYFKLNIGIILLLVAFNILFTNPLGLIVLATSTLLGIYCILSNSKRINMMGALILPSIIYYLTI